MAFGQAAGPPAHARQIDELTALLARAGFESVREARHPFGLNQRQAAGRFTVDEADELIERLRAAEVVAGDDPGDGRRGTLARAARVVAPHRHASPAPSAGSSRAGSSTGKRRRATTLREVDAGVLAAELERRGWCCIPPVGPHDADADADDP